MKLQRLALVLTIVNLLVLGFALFRMRSDSASVLRVRGLEVVDENGVRRAQIVLLPATTGPDGKPYAESVLFRLIDRNGRPGVKIGTSVEGSGMSLAGDSEKRDWSGIQLLAESNGNQVKLTEKDGRVQVIKP